MNRYQYLKDLRKITGKAVNSEPEKRRSHFSRNCIDAYKLMEALDQPRAPHIFSLNSVINNRANEDAKQKHTILSQSYMKRAFVRLLDVTMGADVRKIEALSFGRFYPDNDYAPVCAKVPFTLSSYVITREFMAWSTGLTTLDQLTPITEMERDKKCIPFHLRREDILRYSGGPYRFWRGFVVMPLGTPKAKKISKVRILEGWVARHRGYNLTAFGKSADGAVNIIEGMIVENALTTISGEE